MSRSRKKLSSRKPAPPIRSVKPVALSVEIRQLIVAARRQMAQAVNAGLTMLYWQIGTRIRKDILRNQRAEYGAEIVATLSRQLGWSLFKELIPANEYRRPN